MPQRPSSRWIALALAFTVFSNTALANAAPLLPKRFPPAAMPRVATEALIAKVAYAFQGADEASVHQQIVQWLIATVRASPSRGVALLRWGWLRGIASRATALAVECTRVTSAVAAALFGVFPFLNVAMPDWGPEEALIARPLTDEVFVVPNTVAMALFALGVFIEKFGGHALAPNRVAGGFSQPDFYSRFIDALRPLDSPRVDRLRTLNPGRVIHLLETVFAPGHVILLQDQIQTMGNRELMAMLGEHVFSALVSKDTVREQLLMAGFESLRASLLGGQSLLEDATQKLAEKYSGIHFWRLLAWPPLNHQRTLATIRESVWRRLRTVAPNLAARTEAVFNELTDQSQEFAARAVVRFSEQRFTVEPLRTKVYRLVRELRLDILVPHLDALVGLLESGESTLPVAPEDEHAFRVALEKLMVAFTQEAAAAKTAALAKKIDYVPFAIGRDDDPVSKVFEFLGALDRASIRVYNHHPSEEQTRELVAQWGIQGHPKILEIGPGVALLSILAGLKGAHVTVVEYPGSRLLPIYKAFARKFMAAIEARGGSLVITEADVTLPAHRDALVELLGAGQVDQIWALDVLGPDYREYHRRGMPLGTEYHGITDPVEVKSVIDFLLQLKRPYSGHIYASHQASGPQLVEVEPLSRALEGAQPQLGSFYKEFAAVPKSQGLFAYIYRFSKPPRNGGRTVGPIMSVLGALVSGLAATFAIRPVQLRKKSLPLALRAA